jgi:hypothetical protein
MMDWLTLSIYTQSMISSIHCCYTPLVQQLLVCLLGVGVAFIS